MWAYAWGTAAWRCTYAEASRAQRGRPSDHDLATSCWRTMASLVCARTRTPWSTRVEQHHLMAACLARPRSHPCPVCCLVLESSARLRCARLEQSHSRTLRYTTFSPVMKSYMAARPTSME